ncbi:MAG: exosome complex exonuclease Rrp41 [Candidatus Lokiarchaeota archaeon]|nr:exosome complex exonuclease Rrp41 [Candidatus Lokiarchaeota archaeon]
MELIKLEKPEKLLDENDIRVDGRGLYDLRPIKMKVGILPKAAGSAYVEMGGNKILASVYGPREVHPRHLAKSHRAVLRCLYRMATFSVDERKSPAPSRRENELSMVIGQALEPSVFLEYYPKTMIELTVLIIQADGGTRCASINAGSLALADAGIAMKGIVSAVAVGKINGKLVVDLNNVEDQFGDGDLPVAISNNSKEISLIQFDGTLTYDEFKKCLDMSYDACETIADKQIEALKDKYSRDFEPSEDE